MMEIDTWVSGYKVRSFPWIDGKHIYFNVQYFRPGQSLSQPPAWDKTVYITDDAAGCHLVEIWTSSLAEYVAGLKIVDGQKLVLTARRRRLEAPRSNQLKPCPFCGGKAELKTSYDTEQIECTKCHARTAVFVGDYYDEGCMDGSYATSVWNRRKQKIIDKFCEVM